DHEVLANLLGYLIRDNTGSDVAGCAGTERHHDRDTSRRPVLRRCGDGNSAGREKRRTQRRTVKSAASLHCILPRVFLSHITKPPSRTKRSRLTKRPRL